MFFSEVSLESLGQSVPQPGTLATKLPDTVSSDKTGVRLTGVMNSRNKNPDQRHTEAEGEHPTSRLARMYLHR